MFSNGFIYLVLVAFCFEKTDCSAISPRSKNTNSNAVAPGKKIVVSGSHIEIHITNGQEELNRLKHQVEEFQKSSNKTLAKLQSLNQMNATINSLKAQLSNFSSYEMLITKLQNQINQLMTHQNTFGLVFPRSGIISYVILRHVITSPLAAVTVCFWVKTADTKSCGTAFSYSKGTVHGNELLIYNYQRFEVCINDESRVTSVSANDGKWHHICVTWQSTHGSWALYKDGVRKVHASGLKTGHKIRAGGVIVLGQDQDKDGGGFQAYQSFVGSMAGVNIWSRVLSSQEIFRMSSSCALGKGDVMKWSDVRGHHQNVDEEFFPSCA